MAITASFIETPPIVSLQGIPCIVTATSSIQADNIYMHLCIQELVGDVWTDTDLQDSTLTVDGVAEFDISGYFERAFTTGFSFPEHSSNVVIPRPLMCKAFRIKIWERYTDANNNLIDNSLNSLQLNQTCYMLPGGISDDDLAALNENSTDWWTEHQSSGRALNWMRGTKTISPESIEKIYWIQGTTENVILRFSYTDILGVAGTFDIAFSATAYVPFELSVSPALVRDLTGKEISSYTVSLVGKQMSQAYVIDRDLHEWSEHFLLSNSLGCYEGFWCRGARTGKMNFDRQKYERTDRRNMKTTDRIGGNIRSMMNRIHESNTGHIGDSPTEQWIDWILDLLNSDDAYRIEGESIQPIVIYSESIEFEDQESIDPVSLTFEWHYSRSGKFFSKMGLIAAFIYPPYYTRLSAFFQYVRAGKLIDTIAGREATTIGQIVTFPEITGSDVMDFSDATFWDNSILTWYNPSMPRSCFLDFLVGITWAEAATDATHARLFHHDYSSKPRDVLPLLIYKTNLSAAEQATVVAWLDWYYTIYQDGLILSQDDNLIIQ